MRRFAAPAVVALLTLFAVACNRPAPPPGPGPSSAGPTTTAPATPTTPACSNVTQLHAWSSTQLAEQTVVIPVDESDVSSIDPEVAAGAGGVILFGATAPANLGSSLRTLLSKAPNSIAPFVMTDEEGGDVQRMANLVGDMPSAREMARTMSAAQIEQLAQTVGTKMKANGVTMDLAPVLDLDDGAGPSNSNPDGTRSFSLNESITQADGIAFAQGLEAAGVVPVVKHFPGLGRATGNTDVMAAATQPWSSLQKAGLLPFSAAVTAGVPAVMISNATVPGLSTTPASVSPTVITTVLRGQLHFNGLVITDSLSSTAIHAAGYTVPKATVASLAAGADMILFTANDTATVTKQIVQAVTTAVADGQLPRPRLEDAVGHVLAAKHVDLCRP
jgi:beta-N-acetylhexosaminidase